MHVVDKDRCLHFPKRSTHWSEGMLLRVIFSSIPIFLIFLGSLFQERDEGFSSSKLVVDEASVSLASKVAFGFFELNLFSPNTSSPLISGEGLFLFAAFPPPWTAEDFSLTPDEGFFVFGRDELPGKSFLLSWLFFTADLLVKIPIDSRCAGFNSMDTLDNASLTSSLDASFPQ